MRTNPFRAAPLGALVAVLLVAGTLAADGPAPAAPANAVCPLSGRPVVAAAGTVVYRKETIGFCTAECARRFNAGPGPFMDRMRADPAKYGYRSRWPSRQEMAAAKRAVGSANAVCPVSDRLVRVEGPKVAWQGQTLAFNCPNCSRKFTADPATYMAKMRADPGAYGWDVPAPPPATPR